MRRALLILMCASAPFTWACRADRPQRPETNEAVPDGSQVLQVLDVEGLARVGVPVCLDLGREIVARGVSGVGGLVSFQSYSSENPAMPVGSIALLEVLADESVCAHFPSRTTEPVLLRLPEIGRLEVRLTEAGCPFEGGARLTFQIYDREGVDGDFVPPPRRLLESVVRGPVQGGCGLFVGLGLEIYVRIEAQGRRETSAVVRGPTAFEEVVQAALEVGAALPVLTGVVLDEAGAPLANSRLTVSTRIGPGEQLAAVETDGRGRFRATVDLQHVYQAEAVDHLRFHVSGRPEHRLDLAIEPLVPGEVELGELRLEAAPRVVSGQIVDEDGRPFERVGLQVLLDHGRIVPLTPDGDGSFAWRTFEAVAGPVVLSIPSHDRRLEVPVGTQGLELRLARFGSVRIDLVTDPEWGEALPVKFRMQGAGLEPRDVHRTFRAGVACFERLVPGLYTLEVFAPWCGRGREIVGLEVRPDEETLDPRLLPLDLRFLPPAPRLRVLGEQGQALSLAFHEPVRLDLEAHMQKHLSQFAAVSNDPTHRSCVQVRLLGGEGALFEAPQPLRVWAHGHRPVEIDAPEGDVTVTLQRGPRLSVELTESFPELPEGWGWFLTVRPQDFYRRPFADLPFEGRRLETSVEEPGAYFAAIEAGLAAGEGGFAFLTEFEMPLEGTRLRPVLDENALAELERILERERLQRPR